MKAVDNAHVDTFLAERLCLPQDNAIQLLRTQRDNPAWNLSMSPYWESLPPVGGSLTKQTYPHDSLDMLQDKVLVRRSSSRPFSLHQTLLLPFIFLLSCILAQDYLSQSGSIH